MDAGTLLESIVDIGAKIDDLWSMAIGVHLAIFWMVLVIERPLLVYERLVVLTALCVFEFINGSALVDSYALLAAAQADFLAALGDAAGQYQLHALVTSVDYSQRSLWVLGSHGGALVVVGAIITFQSRIYKDHLRSVRRETQESGEAAASSQS